MRRLQKSRKSRDAIHIIQKYSVPEDVLDIHLTPVPKPNTDRTSTKGYEIVTMQNTLGKPAGEDLCKKAGEPTRKRQLLTVNLLKLQERKGYMGLCCSICI